MPEILANNHGYSTDKFLQQNLCDILFFQFLCLWFLLRLGSNHATLSMQHYHFLPQPFYLTQVRWRSSVWYWRQQKSFTKILPTRVAEHDISLFWLPLCGMPSTSRLTLWMWHIQKAPVKYKVCRISCCCCLTRLKLKVCCTDNIVQFDSSLMYQSIPSVHPPFRGLPFPGIFISRNLTLFHHFQNLNH